VIAPFPTSEAERLDALRSLDLLDTPPEPAFDDLTRLAAFVCGTPIALISLVDPCRQWFKARVGLDATETHRDIAFCSHAILQDDLFVVPDATEDARFKDNPLVTGEPNIRFYAGMPLTGPEGHNLGTLCVIDRVPRMLSPQQQDALRVLARQVTAQFGLRQQVEQMKSVIAEREQVEADLRASDNRFRAIFDTMFEFIGLLAPDGTLLEANQTALDAVGVDRNEVVGQPFPETIWWRHDPLKQSELRDAIQRAAGGEFVRFEATHTLADGSLAVIDFSLKPVFDHSGAVVLLVPEGRDVTDLKRAEEALRESEQRFRSVVEELAEGVYLIDNATGSIVHANTALLKMLAYTANEIANLSPTDLIAKEDQKTLTAAIAALKGGSTGEKQSNLGQRRYCRKDGSLLDVDVQVTFVPNSGAGLLSIVLRDTSEQRAYEARLFEYQLGLEEANTKLQKLAVTDGLTGIKNRSAFNGKLSEEFDRSVRYEHSLSLMLVDVDYFKLFNDEFGHPAGDAVLRIIASTIQAAARTTDFVARYGGEEFAVILPDTDYAGATVLAERCRRAVAEMVWDKRPVTVSIGVATLKPDTADADTLIAQADDALYRSKQKGRNRVTHGTGILCLR
jgi:diguanylate cyclase (GGDEF)-like protein/PAS domain S-box-containing protein